MIASTPAPSSCKFSHASNAQYIMALLLMPQCHLAVGIHTLKQLRYIYCPHCSMFDMWGKADNQIIKMEI